MRKKLFIKTFFILFVISAIIYVPLRTYKQSGNQAAFSYFAGDAFYYLNIAKQSADKGFFTYDRQNPTNGFHPLWQYVASSVYKCSANDSEFLKNVFFINIFILAAAYLILFFALNKLFNSKIISLITLFPGYLFLFFSFVISPEYSPWSFINGMETSLDILFFALFLNVIIKYKSISEMRANSLFAVSLLLTLIGFSRLDDFLLLFVFMFFFFLLKENKKNSRRILALFIIPILTIPSYFIYNYFSAGMILPVSGIHKLSFSFDNFIHLFSFLTVGFSHRDMFGYTLAVRALPVVFVLAISLLLIFYKQKYRLNEKVETNNPFLEKKNDILNILLSYIFLKLILIFIFVDFWHQGTWYFVLPIILANIFISVMSNAYFCIIKNRKLFALITIFGIIIIMNSFVYNKQFSEPANAKFYTNIETIKNHINNDKILEFDDGIIAYSLPVSCLSGFGLAADKEALAAKKTGSFLELAYSRGYRIMASVNYFYPASMLPDSIVDFRQFCRKPFFEFDKENIKKWRFSFVYKDSISGASFVRFSPAEK